MIDFLVAGVYRFFGLGLGDDGLEAKKWFSSLAVIFSDVST